MNVNNDHIQNDSIKSDATIVAGHDDLNASSIKLNSMHDLPLYQPSDLKINIFNNIKTFTDSIDQVGLIEGKFLFVQKLSLIYFLIENILLVTIKFLFSFKSHLILK